MSIKKSTIEQAGYGLFYEGEDPIPINTYFGPYKGKKFTRSEFKARNEAEGLDADKDCPYAVGVGKDDNNQTLIYYDPGNDFDKQENCLAMINMANHYDDGLNVMFKHNVLNDKMYFHVIKPILGGSEILTSYGEKYANFLGIDFETYFPEDCIYNENQKRRRGK